MVFFVLQLLLFFSLAMPNSRSTNCLWLGRVIEDLININSPKKIRLCQTGVRGLCAYDAVNVLRAIENDSSGYDLNNARVLYITYFDDWKYHVVIEYDGLIIDAIEQVDSLGRIVPEAASDYFARHTYSQNSKVGVITSGEYLNGLTSRHPHYYWGNIDQYGGKTLDVFLISILNNQNKP